MPCNLDFFPVSDCETISDSFSEECLDTHALNVSDSWLQCCRFVFVPESRGCFVRAKDAQLFLSDGVWKSANRRRSLPPAQPHKACPVAAARPIDPEDSAPPRQAFGQAYADGTEPDASRRIASTSEGRGMSKSSIHWGKSQKVC